MVKLRKRKVSENGKVTEKKTRTRDIVYDTRAFLRKENKKKKKLTGGQGLCLKLLLF